MARPLLVAARPQDAPAELDALFPGASAPGAPLSWERLNRLSGLYSALYRELVAALSPALAGRAGAAPAAAAVLAREALVPLAHAFFDRLLRLEAFAAARGREAAVARAASPFPSRAEGFQALAAGSPRFNQALLARLAPLAGLAVADAALDLPERAPRAEGAFVNRNFATFTTGQKLARVLRVAARRAGNRRGLIPALSMSYASDALKDAGFFGSYLADLRGKTAWTDAAPEPAARAALRAALDAAAPAPVASFLGAAGSGLDRGAVAAAFAVFAAEAWPSSLWEGAAANVAAATRALHPYRSRPLLFSERGDLESAAMIAGAKTLGMRVIGAQHGGHGGFMADLAVALEVEQYHCDGYITWGWTRFSDYPPLPPQPLTAYALPSPFLSERARRWRATLERSDGPRRWDVLLLSNGVHRFPTAPGCSAQSNIDFLEPYGEMLVGLAAESRRRGVTLLHKPRDPHAAALLAGTLEAMRREGGPGYECPERLDKGMTADLLDRCRVVLWDQPGMGFQECLASGIPTLCYWTRLYNREDAPAAGAFAALERVGVVHRSRETLFAEIESLKRRGARAWLAEPARAEACAGFARAYGWAKDDWARDWTAFLRSL